MLDAAESRKDCHRNLIEKEANEFNPEEEYKHKAEQKMNQREIEIELLKTLIPYTYYKCRTRRMKQWTIGPECLFSFFLLTIMIYFK